MILQVNNISRSFGGLKAVQDVSFSVREGSISALIGPNGAGKTTLFAILSGFLKPDGGSVLFQGKGITGMLPHQICRLGMTRTFQLVQPFAAQSVRENIAVGAHLGIASRKSALAKAEEIARQVGLEEQLHKPAIDLTIAGRKRLELARAIATQPRLLLLDEVLAGLNPQEINEMLPVIRGIRDSGVTVLMIEHVMQAVMTLSEHARVLNNGSLIAEGAPVDIASNPLVIEAYLGHGTAERLRKAMEAADAA